MTDDALVPWDDHLRELLEAERAMTPGADAKLRVLDAVRASIAGLPPPGGSSTPDGGTPPADPGPSLPPPVDPGLAAGAAGLGKLALSAPLLAGVFAVGGLVGAGVYSAIRPPQTNTVYIEVPTKTDAGATPALGVSRTAPKPDNDLQRPENSQKKGDSRLTPKAKPRRKESGFVERPRARDEALRRERALITEAQSALARGQAQAAKRALERHAQGFRTGALTEERIALQIRVFLRLGETEQAKRSAAALIADYPNSLFRPIADKALNAQ